MYVRVYDTNSEPFDVTRDRADRLILQEGWTQSPTAAAPSPEPVAEEVPEETEVEETEIPEEAPAEKTTKRRKRPSTRTSFSE